MALKTHLPIRDAEGADRFEVFLVSSVLSIAVTRIFLVATGFPQLGGDGLHLAHLLWGGLAMLVAQLMFMLFLSRAVRNVATVLAGIGFGVMFAALGQVPEEAGLFPVAVADVTSVPAVIVLAAALRQDWVPRERLSWWGMPVGALVAAASERVRPVEPVAPTPAPVVPEPVPVAPVAVPVERVVRVAEPLAPIPVASADGFDAEEPVLDFPEILARGESVIEFAAEPEEDEPVIMDNGSIRSFNTEVFRIPTFVRKQMD